MKLIRLRDVELLVGIKHTAIYRTMKQGKFPAPIKQGTASFWVERVDLHHALGHDELGRTPLALSVAPASATAGATRSGGPASRSRKHIDKDE